MGYWDGDEGKWAVALALFPNRGPDGGEAWGPPDSGTFYSMCYDLEKV